MWIHLGVSFLFFANIFKLIFRHFLNVKCKLEPITRHGQGQKLGGGKGGIDHYVTPIKRGRIIIELGGYLSPYFLQRTAMEVTEKLPFPAKLVCEQDLIDWENEEKSVKENNLNKLRWEWCIKNNILNVLTYVGKYDIENSHHGPDCR